MLKMWCFLQKIAGLGTLACIMCLPSFAQGKLVLDGANINIHNGASLVITNPAPDAIIRNSGHIISEGENNVLRWHIGTTEGQFSVPWGVGTDKYIPLRFSVAAGEGNGFYTFSTYGTGWHNNSNLPAAISRLERDGADMSAVMVNRFWQINAQNYKIKPSATNLTFSYLQEEASAEGNTLSEDKLQGYRWNEELNQWNDYHPFGDADTNNNIVTISTVDGERHYSWWFLADNISPLPVELVSFYAKIHGNYVKLEWTTASEQNTDFFTIERTKDNVVYEAIKTVKGAGNSSIRIDYEVTDSKPIEGLTYYRLKQVDIDGSVNYSRTIVVDKGHKKGTDFAVYPNPVTAQRFFIQLNQEVEDDLQIKLLDVLGRTVPFKALKETATVVEIIIGAYVNPGTYILQVQDKSGLLRQKVIVR